MMRPLFALIVLLFVCHVTNAQFKVVAEGSVFEEPEAGFSKILQLKNGGTMFFHISIKDGINLKIYDAARKQKVEKTLEPAYGKLKNPNVDGIFEINGDAVLLVSEVDEKRPVLYRLIIDGKTGKLKEETQVAELKKYNLASRHAIYYHYAEPSDFYVRKDANSDNYAVAMFNNFGSDKERRIEIVYYGQDHKELARAFYFPPESRYKYIRYIDMTVIGREKVSVLAYAYNTKGSRPKESELVLANLDAGAKEVSLDELNFSKDEVITGGITRYNPVARKVILLAATKERKNEFSAVLATIDPFKRTVDKTTDLYPVDAGEKSIALFGRKKEYTGLPQNLFINKDGSYSVVYEQLILHIQSSSSFGSTNPSSPSYGFRTTSSRSYYYTDLGNVAVSRFDAEGKELGSYLFPKSHRVYEKLTPFYHSEREGSAQKLWGGGQFKSFAYLNGNDKTYLLFNDVERNAESALKGKITTIQSVGECDGFYFEIAGKEVMPQRNFVFGKPESKKENNLGLFAISDYNPETNVYVTLKLEKEGREKGVRLVWLQPS